MPRSKITPDLVRELLDYDPLTGHFSWRPRSREWFKSDREQKRWNSRYAGRKAGSLRRMRHPARGITILATVCYEHRVAWMWMTGEFPPGEIDHVNRNPQDNRWENLRASSSLENMKNKGMYSRNKSGVTGVCWHKRIGKWQANYRVDGTLKHLGYFDEIDEAAMESMEARRENGFDPTHGIDFDKAVATRFGLTLV